MIFWHPSTLADWNLYADCGTWLVILGVVGEGYEILPKLAKLYAESVLKKHHASRIARARCEESACALCQCATIFCPCAVTRRSIQFFAHPLRVCAEELCQWGEKRKQSIEIIGAVSWIFIVLGLMAELNGNHEAKRIEDADNAVLNDRAYRNELKAYEVKAELAGLRPENQPIGSIHAEVRMYFVRTNLNNLYPQPEVKHSDPDISATLSIEFLKPPNRRYRYAGGLHLKFISNKWKSEPTRFGDTSVIVTTLRAIPDPMITDYGFDDIPEITVGDLDLVDSLTLKIFCEPIPKINVYGKVKLFVNSTNMEYSIRSDGFTNQFSLRGLARTNAIHNIMQKKR